MTKFNNGDMVVVLDGNKYREVPVGAIGIVRNSYETRVTVKFDHIHNPRSGYDCFYFNHKQLRLYEGDKVMEGNYCIATIKFLDGTNTDKTYRYAMYPDLVGHVAVGDICVVKSAHHGLGIAQVVSIEPKTDEKITREIICKCDFSAYYTREAMRKRKAELKSKMAERAAKLQEIALYKMMAAEDDSMAALMREFDELGDY